MTRTELAIAEFSAALEIGINQFAYRGGVTPPADCLESMGWALDNCGVMVGEADRRGLDEWTWKRQRYRLLLRDLRPFWDGKAVAKVFRKSEAEPACRGTGAGRALRTIKAQLTRREIDFKEAIHQAGEHLSSLFFDNMDLGRSL